MPGAGANGGSGAPPLADPLKEVIVLGACGAGEVLPQNAELPADVFTACLTTPIKVRARAGSSVHARAGARAGLCACGAGVVTSARRASPNEPRCTHAWLGDQAARHDALEHP
eukprot:104847-Chlamydomonas_euryale.AAC.1